MRARARLVVELDGRGHSVVRGLRSAAPLTLVPARVHGPGPVTVRLVNSAAAPLAGDDLELTVEVGPGAGLALEGVAATLALPGHRCEPSRFTVSLSAGAGASLAYLPEPTVITARARHESALRADLAAGAELRLREVLVLGRAGECAGHMASEVHIVRGGCPVLRQRLEIGDPALDRGAAHLAGHRVLASDILVDDRPAPAAAGGEWWSLTPLAAGGSVATALAGDAVTALRLIALARG